MIRTFDCRQFDWRGVAVHADGHDGVVLDEVDGIVEVVVVEHGVVLEGDRDDVDWHLDDAVGVGRFDAHPGGDDDG